MCCTLISGLAASKLSGMFAVQKAPRSWCFCSSSLRGRRQPAGVQTTDRQQVSESFPQTLPAREDVLALHAPNLLRTFNMTIASGVQQRQFREAQNRCCRGPGDA